MSEVTKFRERSWQLIGCAAALAGAAALTGCGGNSNHETEATGKVECATGRNVEGVYIDADKSTVGFAQWAAEDGRPNIAHYKYRLDEGGGYSVHVGCGGTTSEWASDTWYDGFVHSNESHSFICHDSKTRSAAEPVLACDEVEAIP